MLLRLDAERYDHRLGPIVQHLLRFGHSDPVNHLSPQRWCDRRRFELHRHAPGQHAHSRRLFGLLLCMDAERHDDRMGPVLKHLLIFSYADPIGCLSSLRWHHGCRFQLHWNETGCHPHRRRLLVLHLCLDAE